MELQGLLNKVFDETNRALRVSQTGVTDATYVTLSSNAVLTAEKVLGTDVIMSGTEGAKPEASSAGRLYFATDTALLYRDTGAAWVQIAAPILLGLTQTYSTTNTTHANPTSSALTDSTGATPDTTVVDLPSLQPTPTGLVSGERAAIRNNFADLTTQINNLRTDVLNLKQFVNSAVDQLQ